MVYSRWGGRHSSKKQGEGRGGEGRVGGGGDSACFGGDSGNFKLTPRMLQNQGGRHKTWEFPVFWGASE